MDWKGKIESALKMDLPGACSHIKMLPPGRDLSFRSERSERIRKSSVLLLLFEEGNEVFICLIKRPGHMKNHPGQIGLPGGMVELSDFSMVETALRESREELGIDTRSISVIGSLSELYVPVSKFLIFPVVAWSDKKPRFSINRDEVEELIFFPLFYHIHSGNTENGVVETLNGPLNVPCIRYNKEIIWGATAMILTEFIDLIREFT